MILSYTKVIFEMLFACNMVRCLLCCKSCLCGVSFTVEHALSCPRGGFFFVCHNHICDSIAQLLKEICHDVSVEPGLQPLTGGNSHYRSVDDQAHLDIAACGFYGISHQRASFDVRVFNP